MITPESSVLLVLTNLPDAATAKSLATQLIERRLAACVNILAPCQSVYRWRDAVEETSEVPLFIKTTTTCYPRLEEAIRALHPYELPEIIALPVTRGLPGYLAWVNEETAGAEESSC